MKTLLFILDTQADSAQSQRLTALLPTLEKIAEDRFELKTIASLDEMEAHLPETANRIVLLSTTGAKELGTLIIESRQIAPSCSLISVLETTEHFPANVWGQDVQCLATPVDAFQLASALNTAEQQSALRARLITGKQFDEVDNLLSRPYFMHRLSEEISVARRHKAPMCCVILSLNYYRMYMDSYGYEFTNALLHFAADEINKLIRYEDQVARVSDDELGLLLARCNEADAKKLIQRLADTLNQLTFQFGEFEEELSVSAGVVCYPLPENEPANPDILVRYAHHALYQAKNSEEEAHSVSLFSEIKPHL